MAPPDDTPVTSRALLSQAEAAAACGVSEATIRRARKAGRIQDVQPDPAGGYRIPVSSLLAAGFTLDRVTRDPQVSPSGTPTVTPPATPQTPPPHRTTYASSWKPSASAPRTPSDAQPSLRPSPPNAPAPWTTYA